MKTKTANYSYDETTAPGVGERIRKNDGKCAVVRVDGKIKEYHFFIICNKSPLQRAREFAQQLLSEGIGRARISCRFENETDSLFKEIADWESAHGFGSNCP